MDLRSRSNSSAWLRVELPLDQVLANPKTESCRSLRGIAAAARIAIQREAFAIDPKEHRYKHLFKERSFSSSPKDPR